MEIDNESLEEFVRLYREEFGEKITKDNALILTRNLIVLYEWLSRVPKDQAAQESG